MNWIFSAEEGYRQAEKVVDKIFNTIFDQTFSAEEGYGQAEKIWDGYGHEHWANGLGWRQQKGLASYVQVAINFI